MPKRSDGFRGVIKQAKLFILSCSGLVWLRSLALRFYLFRYKLFLLMQQVKSFIYYMLNTAPSQMLAFCVSVCMALLWILSIY